jgi:hypothetical protein
VARAMARPARGSRTGVGGSPGAWCSPSLAL